MYENGNSTESAAAAKRAHGRRARAGVVVSIAAVLSFPLIGMGVAAAASPGSSGGHVVADSHGGGGGGGGGTWDQTKVPLPHLPGQAPTLLLQSQDVADVVALDQTDENAADDSMIAFYQNNTACTVNFTPMPSVKFTVTCPHGTATLTDGDSGGTLFHTFRMVN